MAIFAQKNYKSVNFGIFLAINKNKYLPLYIPY